MYGANVLPDPIDSVLFVAVVVEGERAGAITGLELGTKGAGSVTYQTAQTLPGSGSGCVAVWLPEDPDTAAAWTESAVDALSLAVRLA